MTTIAPPTARPRSVTVRVARVIDETADARSLVFEVPAEAATQFAYRPGQFLTVRVPSTRTGSVARCYSLASAPGVDDHLMVTVKRTRSGYGSNWLCDNVSAGDALDVLPPSGIFTPSSPDDDLLLWGAGSGITPLFSILKATLTGGRGRIAVIYANRDPESVIFAEDLRRLAARHPDRLTVIHWLESLLDVPTAEQLAALAAPFADRQSYICGPGGFMAAAKDALGRLEVDRSRVHAEIFTSLTGDPFAAPTSGGSDTADDTSDSTVVEVETDGQTHRLSWPRSSNLVDVMISYGLEVPYSCREGSCGTCACTVVSGDVVMTDPGVLDADDIEAGYVLACQARPDSAVARIRF